MIIKQQFTITYEREIDSDTGEILKTIIVSSSDVKPEKKKKTLVKDTDTEPKAYLEDNKLRLNSLAIDLLRVKAGDRIDVQYTDIYPVIGLSESFGNPEGGTKLTKSNTLSFRGKKFEVLSKFGTEFKVVKSDNRFILDNGSDVKVAKEPAGDENVNTDDVDFNLDDFLDDEVKSSMFQL